MPILKRVFIFSLVAFALALWGGLQRIGWNINPVFGELPGVHGPFMVCGFLGSLFALDRVMAVPSKFGWMVPASIQTGCFLLLIWPIGFFPTSLVLVGSLGFCWMSFIAHRLKPHLYNLMIFLGSLHWLIGIAIWFVRWPVFNVYVWWSGFIMFTLIGERLELASRINRVEAPLMLLKAFLLIVIAGEVAMALHHLWSPDSVMEIVLDSIVDPRTVWGMRFAGVGKILVAVWLLRYDAAWGLLRIPGTARHTALCLISSYVWLIVCGVMSIFWAGTVSGFRYDALIHSFFVGFVFSLIFGHAPILAMSSLGLRVKFTRFFYLPFGLLQGSLVLRMIGDAFRDHVYRMAGGALNGAAFVAFAAVIGVVLIKSNILFRRIEKPNHSASGTQMAA